MQEKTEQKETILQKYLKERGLKLREFSRLSNVAVSTLHAILHGQRSPKPRIALKICKATRFSITPKDFGLK